MIATEKIGGFHSLKAEVAHEYLKQFDAFRKYLWEELIPNVYLFDLRKRRIVNFMAEVQGPNYLSRTPAFLYRTVILFGTNHGPFSSSKNLRAAGPFENSVSSAGGDIYHLHQNNATIKSRGGEPENFRIDLISKKIQ